jgi:F0F1-type ATP synthase membrane subunit b/b'
MKRLATLLLAGAFTLTAAAALVRVQDAPSEAGGASEAKEGESGGEGHGMAGWEWANFALLVGGLGYLAAKHAGPFFESRSRKIRQGIAEAEMVRKEAEERAGQVAQRLANLEADIAVLRQSSKAEIEAETARMAARTTAEMAKIRAQAESEIVAAGKAARTELKRFSAHLAVALAEQKVRAGMNEQTQEGLLGAFLHDLGDSSARAETL